MFNLSKALKVEIRMNEDCMIKASTEAMAKFIKTVRLAIDNNLDLHLASFDFTLSKINLKVFEGLFERVIGKPR